MTSKPLLSLMAAVGLACLAVASRRASLAAQAGNPNYQPFPTVWSGVYAKTDAERGKQTSAQLCSRCHGADLKGSPTAPGLVGSKFFDRWHDLKVGDVVAYIQAAMPREHEFFVSAQSTREIVSLMLQESGIPPGKQSISSDLKRLDEILITRPAPAK